MASATLVRIAAAWEMDAELVGKLQRLSSQSASAILDVLGVLHLQQGNVLEIRSRKLFVAEACSGVDSLYALGAVSIFITLLRQKSFIVALLSILTVPLWAWLGNVMRLISITLLLEFANVDVSSGWKHTVLGLVIFALMAFFFFRALEGFSQLFRRFSTASLPQSNRQWHLAYNRFVCFPEAPPVLKTEQDMYFDESVVAPTASAKKGRQPKPSKQPQRSSRSASKWGALGLCLVTGVACFTLSLVLILRTDDLQNAMRLPQYSVEQVDKAIPREALPPTLLKATQVGFKGERRAVEDFYGEFSRTWNYEDQLGPFILSIDFPFRDYHPLWVCYTNIGQKVVVRSSEEYKITALGGTRPATVHRVELVDDANNHSYLLFVNFDKGGAPVGQESDESLQNAILNRLLRPSPMHFRLPPVAYQGQLYVNSGAALSTQDKKRYESIFVEALPHMMSAVQKLTAEAK